MNERNKQCDAMLGKWTCDPPIWVLLEKENKVPEQIKSSAMLICFVLTWTQENRAHLGYGDIVTSIKCSIWKYRQLIELFNFCCFHSFSSSQTKIETRTLLSPQQILHRGLVHLGLEVHQGVDHLNNQYWLLPPYHQHRRRVDSMVIYWREENLSCRQTAFFVLGATFRGR